MNNRNLPKPRTQLSEVLYYLLENQYGHSRMFFIQKWILNAPACINVLRRLGVSIGTKKHHLINKFGRNVTYSSYVLTNVEQATEIYLKLIHKKTKK